MTGSTNAEHLTNLKAKPSAVGSADAIAGTPLIVERRPPRAGEASEVVL